MCSVSPAGTFVPGVLNTRGAELPARLQPDSAAAFPEMGNGSSRNETKQNCGRGGDWNQGKEVGEVLFLLGTSRKQKRRYASLCCWQGAPRSGRWAVRGRPSELRQNDFFKVWSHSLRNARLLCVEYFMIFIEGTGSSYVLFKGDEEQPATLVDCQECWNSFVNKFRTDFFSQWARGISLIFPRQNLYFY